MAAAAFPFFVNLFGVLAAGTPVPGIFCLLDCRSEDPDRGCEVGEVLLASEAAAFRFRDVGVAAGGGAARSAEAAAFAASESEEGEPDRLAAWLAA
jgi:hypothetical protein